MSTIKEPHQTTEDRVTLLYEQLERLLRHAWLPHFMLVVCGLFGVLMFELQLQWAVRVGVPVALGLLVSMRWLLWRTYRREAVGQRNYGIWRSLQLAGALLTGTLTTALMVILLPQLEGWQQMLLLAMLVAVLISFWLASAGCLLSLLGYVLPVVAGTLWLLVSAGHPELQALTVLLAGLILFELLAGSRVAALDSGRLMLKQLLLQAREQQSRDRGQQQRELAQLLTRKQSLRLQLDSLQAHLERNSDEQTRSLKQALDQLRTSEERLQRALDASALALWDWDLVTGRVYQTGAEKLFGMEPGQAGQLLADLRPLMHPDDLQVLREAMVAHLRQETTDYRVEYRIRHADGHWVWIEDSGQAIARDADGRVLRMLGTRRDITERREHEERLKLASIVFDTGSEAIMVMNAALKVLTTNQAFTRITGYSTEDAQGFKDRLQQSLAVFGLGSVRQILLEQGTWHAELTGVRSSGSSFPLRLRLRAVYAHDGTRLTHVVAFFTDMTQFREAQQRLDYPMP